MGMSVGDGGGEGAPMTDINTTPLVDVMLVLLIIFMITAPLMADKVKITLPTAENVPEASEQVSRVTLSIQDRGDGTVAYYWEDDQVQWDGLVERLKVVAKAAPKIEQQQEIRIRADRTVQYKHISLVMQEAKKIGVAKVAFATDPGHGS